MGDQNSSCPIFYYRAALPPLKRKKSWFGRWNMQTKFRWKSIGGLELMGFFLRNRCEPGVFQKHIYAWVLVRGADLLGSHQFWTKYIKMTLGIVVKTEGRRRRLSTYFIFISLSSHTRFQEEGSGGEMTWREQRGGEAGCWFSFQRSHLPAGLSET